MNKIRQITIITQAGTRDITVNSKVNSIMVNKIEDKSFELENQYFSLYNALDENGKIIVAIENCPIIIDYYPETEYK